MRLIQATLISVFVSGCAALAMADEPPATLAQPAANATPSTVAAAKPQASAPADAAKSAANDAPAAATPEQDKLLRAAGYRPETQKGQTLYCRKEATLGTRFQSKVCGTPADLAEQTRQSQEMAGSIQRKNVYMPKGS